MARLILHADVESSNVYDVTDEFLEVVRTTLRGDGEAWIEIVEDGRTYAHRIGHEDRVDMVFDTPPKLRGSALQVARFPLPER